MSALVELAERESKMLLDAYRGRLRSISCDALGDKSAYDRATGKWKNVGKVNAEGRAWNALKAAGLIHDYDSFGGFHYCKITKAGERQAERLIALRAHGAEQ